MPALWNLFSRAGRSAAVVGWWASWPAETIRGTVVSDRVAPQLIRAGSELDPAAISPPRSTRAPVALARPRGRDRRRGSARAYPRVAAERVQTARAALARAGGRFYDDPSRISRPSWPPRAATGRSPRRCSDPIGPTSWRSTSRPSTRCPIASSATRPLGPAAIAQAYRDVDTLLARLAVAAPSGTWILVCSDHGFHPPRRASPSIPAELAGPASAWHRPYGIVAAIEAEVLAGRAQGRLRDAGRVTPLDIAPTILHAAGLPVSLEMPGRVVQALVPDALAKALRPPRRRRRCHARQRPPRARPTLRARAGSRRSATSARRHVAGRLNLGEILYAAGDYDGAERELRAVLGRQPDNLSAWLWLARVTAAQDRPQAALDLYERALAPEGAQRRAGPGGDPRGPHGPARRSARSWPPLSPAERRAERPVARAMLAVSAGEAQRSRARAARGPPPILPRSRRFERLFDLLMPAGRAASGSPPPARRGARAGLPARSALLGACSSRAATPAGAEEQPGARPAARAGRALRCVSSSRARSSASASCEAARATLAPVPASRERSVLLGVAASRASAGRRPRATTARRSQPARPDKDMLNALAWALRSSGRSREAAELLDRSLDAAPRSAGDPPPARGAPAPAPGPRCDASSRLVAAVSAALLAVFLADAPRSGALAAPNVLLVTIDTLRADRLGCYGYAAAATPVLDALAARGVRFATAIAHAPLTGAVARLDPHRPAAARPRRARQRRVRAARRHLPTLAEAFRARRLPHRGLRLRLPARPPLRLRPRLRDLRRPAAARQRPAARGLRRAHGRRDDDRGRRSTGSRGRAAPVVRLGALLRPARALRAAGRARRRASRTEPLRRRDRLRRPRARARCWQAAEAARADARSSSSPRTTARAWASTARRRTASSSTTRRCGCRGSWPGPGVAARPGVATSSRAASTSPPRSSTTRGCRLRAGAAGSLAAAGGGGTRDAGRPRLRRVALLRASTSAGPQLHALAHRALQAIEAPRPELYDLEADPGESRDVSAAHARRGGARSRRRAAAGARRPEPPDAPHDPGDEARERLRALGYLGGTRARASHGARPEGRDRARRAAGARPGGGAGPPRARDRGAVGVPGRGARRCRSRAATARSPTSSRGATPMPSPTSARSRPRGPLSLEDLTVLAESLRLAGRRDEALAALDRAAARPTRGARAGAAPRRARCGPWAASADARRRAPSRRSRSTRRTPRPGAGWRSWRSSAGRSTRRRRSWRRS